MSLISELFERDPLQHTKEDIDAIIAEMREKRNLFNTEGAKAKAKPKADPGKNDDLLKELGLL